jgi:nuclear pore complex protein Nup188
MQFLLLRTFSHFRVLIPLFRAKENSEDLLFPVALEFLLKIIPNSLNWLLMNIYENKGEKINEDPKAATLWVKQTLKEQLVLLEVLFWTVWEYVSCSGPLLESLFSAAYSITLGSSQINSTLLLDEESVQLTQDCTAIWILITIEVLELESLASLILLSYPTLLHDHKCIMHHRKVLNEYMISLR